LALTWPRSSALLTDLKPQPHTKGGERSLAPLAVRITQWQEDGVQVLLVVSNSVQAAHLQHLLLGQRTALPVLTEPKWETETTTPGAAIAVGHLSQGFLLLLIVTPL